MLRDAMRGYRVIDHQYSSMPLISLYRNGSKREKGSKKRRISSCQQACCQTSREACRDSIKRGCELIQSVTVTTANACHSCIQMKLLLALLLVLSAFVVLAAAGGARVGKERSECSPVCKRERTSSLLPWRTKLTDPSDCCRGINAGKDHPKGGICFPSQPPIAFCYTD